MSEKHKFYETCAYFTAARYERLVENLAQKIFEPTQLAPSYSYIMMALEDSAPLTISQLSEILVYDHSSISRMIKTLANKNLVMTSTNGRSTEINLTDEGVLFLKTANKCLEKLKDSTNNLFGVEEKQRMTTLLTQNAKLIQKKLD